MRELNKEDFKVGNTVALRFQGNRARREDKGEKGYILRSVEKIARKYITVNGIQFDVTTGYDKSDYSAMYELYESEEVLLQQLEREEALSKLRSAFNYGYRNDNTKFTNEQLLKVIKILEL